MTSLFAVCTLCKHTSAEGHLGYEKCLQGSVNGFWALLMGYFENQLSPKYWLGAFWENQLFSFWGLLQAFFDLKKTIFGIGFPNFWGLILLKLSFLMRAIGLKPSRVKNGYFWFFQLLNDCLDQKVLEVWPPKVGISNAI